MKMNRFTVLAVVVLIMLSLVLPLAGCSNTHPAVGEWWLAYDWDGPNLTRTTLENDGTMTQKHYKGTAGTNLDSGTGTGTWVADGDRITLTFTGSEDEAEIGRVSVYTYSTNADGREQLRMEGGTLDWPAWRTKELAIEDMH